MIIRKHFPDRNVIEETIWDTKYIWLYPISWWHTADSEVFKILKEKTIWDVKNISYAEKWDETLQWSQKSTYTYNSLI
jgi:hypothetical protein